jgi:hypothetical protein
MKCSSCDFENRPDARFCKNCGQPLQVQASQLPAPAPQGSVCSACGATAKPGARFCPRCGRPLAAGPAPPPPSTTQPSMPGAPPQATQPSMPPLPQQPTYGTPPPPAAPPPTKRRLPGWIPWVGGIVVFLCLAVLVVAAIAFGPKLIAGRQTPSATPTAVETPTGPVEATLVTGTPAPESATATPPTETPPAETPTGPPPTESPEPPPFAAQVGIAASAADLQAGDLVTVTVTITNTGQATFGNLRYQLLGAWEPYLEATAGTLAEHATEAGPGQSDSAVFVLQATQGGTATLQANVTLEIADPPRLEGVLSAVVEVTVAE